MRRRFRSGAEHAAFICEAIPLVAESSDLELVADAIVDDTLLTLRSILIDRRLDALSARNLLDHLSGAGALMTADQRFDACLQARDQERRADALQEAISLIESLCPRKFR